MRNIRLGLIWAAAIIMVALAGANGIIPGDVSKALIFTLPILAVIALGRSNGCTRRGAA